ncbi:replicative DNA helicase [Trichloromonas acetexigens]|jgi:replicative DNA helicase|uniref:Replicative DNA helicase n=1 Tax=Trichloromonas acetexigens TaxID=38815 RepID=A0A550JDJ2_9BACT|nr:replicative DNA helicase [Desulfuromonas acetexigens]TRO81256.1 replicative DNA helicase [Desulfuromonas acetexigens]
MVELPAHRLPPQSLEGEMSVLGGVLLENEALNKALEILRPEDFYREAHRKIFSALIDLSDKGEPADLVTLTAALQLKGDLEAVGGSAYLATLVDYVPTAANIVYYCRMVKDKAVSRRLIQVATEIATRGYEGGDVEADLDWAEKSIFEIAGSKAKPSYFSTREIMKDTFKTIEKLYDRKELITGVPTGFSDLDLMTAGLQGGDLVIIAARPSMGKTAFCLNIVEHAALHAAKPVPSIVFSLEMGKEQLVQRLLCSVSRVDASRLRTGHLGESDWPKLTNGAGLLSEAPIFIDDTPSISVLELRAKARRLKAEHDLGLVVVDYLQLMQGRNAESRQQEISEISRSLKALAKELHVPVVALSQLNRSLESRTDKRPMMADLRESGAIEQDADVIMFIYRDAVYCEACKRRDNSCDKGHDKDAEVIIGKQRNGPIGSVHLTFRGEFTRFENQSKREGGY